VGALAEVFTIADRAEVRIVRTTTYEAALGRDHEISRVWSESVVDEGLVGVRTVGIRGVDERDPGLDDAS
jgi:hypothetical protein